MKENTLVPVIDIFVYEWSEKLETFRFAYCGYDYSSPLLAQLCSDGHVLTNLYTWATDDKYDTTSAVRRLAQEHDAQVSVKPFTDEEIKQLQSKGVNLFICAGYPYKIPPSISSLKYAFNIHPSNLPYGKGKWPMPHQILNQVEEIVVTAHEFSQKWDAGPIIHKRRAALETTDTHETLSAKIALLSIELTHDILTDPDAFFLASEPQEGGSYDEMPDRSDRFLDWELPLPELTRKVRAFGRFCSYAQIEGRNVLVREAHPIEWEHKNELGSVRFLNGGNVLVAVNGGYLLITDFEIGAASYSS